MKKPASSLLFLALLAGCNGDNMMTADAGADDGPGVPVAATYRATHYDFTMDLATRVARSQVTAEIVAPGNCLTIGFEPAAATDVTLDGQVPDSVAVQNATLAACRAGLRLWNKGDRVILAATAEVPQTTIKSSQVGYSVRKDMTGQPFTYLVSWVNGCDHHGACDAAPDRFATYRFTVDHPAGTGVLCPGTIKEESATRTVCDFNYDGGPTYSGFGFAASPSWKTTALGDWGGVKVDLYDYAPTGIAAALDRAAAQAHFVWMQSLFGAYPYGKELRFVVGPTYWSGFEHPGNIVLAETLARGQSSYSDGLRHVQMHEVVHQWAGDRTTLAGTYDFVWKEAMAEYLTFIYEDEKIAPDDGQTTAAAWKEWSRVATYYPVPGEKPELFNYYGDAYGPGPMVLFRQLESMYSRKAVQGALKSLIGGPAPRALSIDDVRMALEQATGAKLDNYFNAWVRGMGRPAWPRATVKVTDVGGGTSKVELTVTTKDNVPRGCAFKIRLLGDVNKGEHYDVPVNLGPDGGPFAPAMVKPGFAVTGSEVDPLNECLIWPAGTPPLVKPDPSAIERTEPMAIEPWRAVQ